MVKDTNNSVAELTGIGAATARDLEEEGVETVGDFIEQDVCGDGVSDSVVQRRFRLQMYGDVFEYVSPSDTTVARKIFARAFDGSSTQDHAEVAIDKKRVKGFARNFIDLNTFFGSEGLFHDPQPSSSIDLLHGGVVRVTSEAAGSCTLLSVPHVEEIETFSGISILDNPEKILQSRKDSHPVAVKCDHGVFCISPRIEDK